MNLKWLLLNSGGKNSVTNKVVRDTFKTNATGFIFLVKSTPIIFILLSFLFSRMI